VKKLSVRPAIIYADPPYSSAQYSRYYHILDTLLTYDYPPISGVGRYPPNRFHTSFATKDQVRNAMTRLVSRTARLGTNLVLSYPANGLYFRMGGNVLHLLKEYYKDIDLLEPCEQSHSSFGGPRADPKILVKEQIYIARCPISNST